MSKVENAVECFNSGFNCSQAVFATYCEQFGLDRETALKIATPFGSGLARQAKICGAVSGAIMLIGLKSGKCLPDDNESKEKCFALATEFTKRFNQIHGSINCCDLLKNDLSTPEGLQYIKDNHLWDTLCPIFIRDACQLLEEMLDLD